MGGTIYWNSENLSATVSVMNKNFVFYANESYSTIDGLDYLNTSAKFYNNTMFVPVKLICDHLGFTVNWDSFYYVAEITAPNITVPETLKDLSYTKDDILWLAKIVQIESGGEKLPTRIGVANTVVNRMMSPLYPNTIKDVILDKKHSVQFPPAHTDKINVTPSYISMIAAKCALNGTELVGDAVSFVNVNRFEKSWVAKNLTHVISIGNLGFFAN
ncbi:MAG: cell wall hydrolase [Clostridia bacterium]|nr:cell wall hydrolase [Clostridia bacterium]